jgi:hypothetical protein
MISPATLGVLIPIFALCIPIVAILTRHQQKMAETFAQNQGMANYHAGNDAIAVREEVRQLRELVTSQSILIDDLRSEIRSTRNLDQQLKQQN